MEFTKEEISLCKQVVEKYRKELVHGDWYISYDGVIKLKALHQKGYRHEECIPLWTISDCLEFLREHKWHIWFWNEIGTESGLIEIGLQWLEECKQIWGKGKTPLEACLKAVLAVLEG